MNNLLQIYHRRPLSKSQKKIYEYRIVLFCRALGGRRHDFESNKRVFDMVSVGEGERGLDKSITE